MQTRKALSHLAGKVVGETFFSDPKVADHFAVIAKRRAEAPARQSVSPFERVAMRLANNELAKEAMTADVPLVDTYTAAMTSRQASKEVNDQGMTWLATHLQNAWKSDRTGSL